eukprot:scaffold5639_cov25-Tisochrysis_lutea.AAC.2
MIGGRSGKQQHCPVTVQVKLSPVKVFAIHLEVTTADLCVHRVSISTMYRDQHSKVGACYQHPCVNAACVRTRACGHASIPYLDCINLKCYACVSVPESLGLSRPPSLAQDARCDNKHLFTHAGVVYVNVDCSGSLEASRSPTLTQATAGASWLWT